MAPNVVEFGYPGAAEVLDDRDVLLTRREAAQYLRKSIPTLERWAREGVGPKPVKIRRAVHYRLRDLRTASNPEAMERGGSLSAQREGQK